MKKVNTSEMELNVHFSDLMQYFNSNTPPAAVKQSKTSTKAPVKVQIPLFFAYLDEPFNQVSTSVVTISQMESKTSVCYSVFCHII